MEAAGLPSLVGLAGATWASPESKEEVARVLANVSMLPDGAEACLEASVAGTLVAMVKATVADYSSSMSRGQGGDEN